MQLFKRMMLSLFPDEMVNNPMNPASIFIWFISAKQYFSVITRKIVENYKLNLFDISLDPFEVKIWFGDSPTIKVKDVDFYYWYAAAANLNWYRSFAPWQVAHVITLVTSLYIIDEVEKHGDDYGIQFLYAVYLLTFIFQAKIKIFPHDNAKENFSWFIEILFTQYMFLLEQSGKKFDPKIVADIRKTLLQDHLEVLFMLYYFYQFAAQSLDVPQVQLSQFYGWLFYDELKWWQIQPIAQDFLEHAHISTKATNYSTTEKNLIHLLFPADILIRYIVEGESLWSTIRHFISHFFDTDKIHDYVRSFLKNDAWFEEFLIYVSDYNHFRSSYFDAMKKYITHTFQKKEHYEVSTQPEEMDEWMSAIGEWWAIDMSRIPARLKQESETMERLMNFYITYIGWYRIWRGDSRYMRCFAKECIAELMEHMSHNNKHDAYYYFSWLLYSYSKNVFYYKYAFENIRAGKDKFHLPFRATFREVYSNACIIKLFESSFIAALLQDILPKDIKLYIKNPTIVGLFATYFQKNISVLVRQKSSWLLKSIYSIYDPYFSSCVFSDVVINHFAKHPVTHIKESLYSPDFWIYKVTIEHLQSAIPHLQEKYGDTTISGILSTLRETILGFYLYATFVEMTSAEKWQDSHIDALCKIYILDVLNVWDEYAARIVPMIKHVLGIYCDLFHAMNGIDDNMWYIKIARDNWEQYCYKKKPEDIFWGLSGEDIIWFRGFLKTISYYNKRYIIPHQG
jgi:hypothetical protein